MTVDSTSSKIPRGCRNQIDNFLYSFTDLKVNLRPHSYIHQHDPEDFPLFDPKMDRFPQFRCEQLVPLWHDPRSVCSSLLGPMSCLPIHSE